MFSNEYGEAALEVLDILDNTNKSDVAKIPTSFIKFLVDNASEDYRVNLDHSKLISEMNLKEKTKEILGVIYINWWCDKKDKENYTKQIKELEVKRQEEIKEKYNPNKIFENKVQEYTNATKVDTVQNEAVAMIEYKDRERLFVKKYWILYLEQKDNMEKIVIPKSKWIQIRINSQEPEDIQRVSENFYDYFIPSTKYNFRELPELEYYHDDITDFLIPIED